MQYQKEKTIAWPTWNALSGNRKMELLQEGYSFDELTCQIYNWVELFRTYGAIIDNDTITNVYRHLKGE